MLMLICSGTSAFSQKIESMDKWFKVLDDKSSSRELVQKASLTIAKSEKIGDLKKIVAYFDDAFFKRLDADVTYKYDENKLVIGKLLVLIASNKQATDLFEELQQNKILLARYARKKAYFKAIGYMSSPTKKTFDYVYALSKDDGISFPLVHQSMLKINSRESINILVKLHLHYAGKNDPYQTAIRNYFLTSRHQLSVVQELEALIFMKEAKPLTQELALEALFSYHPRKWFKGHHDLPRPKLWNKFETKVLEHYIVIADKALKLKLKEELARDIEGVKQFIEDILQMRKNKAAKKSN